MEEGAKSTLYPFRILELTFPYHERTPPKLPESATVSFITDSVTTEFWDPVRSSRFWQPGNLAPAVAMPEAAVKEDHLLFSGKAHIWTAREACLVQFELVPE